jgi:hypothetical protein
MTLWVEETELKVQGKLRWQELIKQSTKEKRGTQVEPRYV